MTRTDPALPPEERETVLVLEDDILIRKAVRRVLERAGYAVLGAATPAEAMELAADHGSGLRLLITDFSFHPVTGHEVYERLRRDRPDLRVLYISGHLELDVLPPERQQPASRFLQKPFSMGALLDEVRALLQ